MNSQLIQYVNSLTAAINQTSDCRTLGVLEQEVLANMRSLLAQVISQIAILGALAEIPTDLDQAIQWITNFINQNIIGPFEKSILLEAELILAIEQLTLAINNKYANLSCLYHPIQALQTMGNQLAGNALMGG